MNYANNVSLLDSRRIPYRVHLYTYGEGLHSATEVADAIGLPAGVRLQDAGRPAGCAWSQTDFGRHSRPQDARSEKVLPKLPA